MFKKFLFILWAISLLTPSIEETLHFLNNHHEVCQDHDYTHLHQEKDDCDHDIFTINPYVGFELDRLEFVAQTKPSSKPQSKLSTDFDLPTVYNRLLRGPPVLI